MLKPYNTLGKRVNPLPHPGGKRPVRYRQGRQ
ncbi:hypothetical protein V6Z11_D13G179800 [Gossypium hirsutum]